MLEHMTLLDALERFGNDQRRPEPPERPQAGCVTTVHAVDGVIIASPAPCFRFGQPLPSLRFMVSLPLKPARSNGTKGSSPIPPGERCGPMAAAGQCESRAFGSGSSSAGSGSISCAGALAENFSNPSVKRSATATTTAGVTHSRSTNISQEII